MGEKSAFVSASQAAKALGTSSATILGWYREGYFPAEIAEGRVFRFDLRKVKAALAERAKRHQENTDWIHSLPKEETPAPALMPEPKPDPETAVESSGFWGPRRGKRNIS